MICDLNGFIAFDTDTGAAAAPEAFCPADARFLKQSCWESSLSTWSTGKGDIAVSFNGSRSFLLLSGYINGGLPGAPDQNEIVPRLHALFDEGVTVGAVGQLAARLSGSFALLYQDRRRRKSLCISDRIGSRPLWLKRYRDSWVVSSHVSAIALSTAARLDAAGLACFLLYGGQIDPGRSAFEGVFSVRPGTILELDHDGATTSHRWYAFQHRPDYSRSLDDWMEEAASRLVQAASRITTEGGRLAVFFSGGVDSRLTAAALRRSGAAPQLVTLSDGVNLEARVARLAAQALGLQHRLIVRDPRWYLRTLPRATYEAGLGYVFTHGHFSAAAASLVAEDAADTFLLGDFGEAFSKLFCSVDGHQGRLWTPEQFAESYDVLRLPLYRPRDPARTLSLFKPSVRTTILEQLRQQKIDQYNRVLEASKEPLIVGDLCFRWGSAASLPTFYMLLDLRARGRERNLMFDPDVQQILEFLPAGVRNGRNLGGRLVRRFAEAAGWVPNSNSLIPMFWPSSLHKATRMVKPTLGRVRRRLLGQSHRTTGSWPEHSRLYCHDEAWRQLFEGIVQEHELFDEAGLDARAVASTWEAFAKGETGNASDVEKLVQIGLTQRMCRDGVAAFAGSRTASS